MLFKSHHYRRLYIRRSSHRVICQLILSCFISPHFISSHLVSSHFIYLFVLVIFLIFFISPPHPVFIVILPLCHLFHFSFSHSLPFLIWSFLSFLQPTPSPLTSRHYLLYSSSSSIRSYRENKNVSNDFAILIVDHTCTLYIYIYISICR